jgi:hypothetical protein
MVLVSRVTEERRIVPFQGFDQPMGIAFYFEDLDSAIGRACCEAAAVVIEDCIVLSKSVAILITPKGRCRKSSIRRKRGIYYHFIMTGVRDNLCHVDTELLVL